LLIIFAGIDEPLKISAIPISVVVPVFSNTLHGLPNILRALFRRRLDRYEMREVMDVEPPRDVVGIPALSGAFMLVKRVAIDSTGGFDPKYFLYFEDFDWSVRLNRMIATAIVNAQRAALRSPWVNTLLDFRIPASCGYRTQATKHCSA